MLTVRSLESGVLVISHVGPGSIIPGPMSFNQEPMEPRDPEPAIRLACLAMRTRFELLITDDRDPAALRAAGEEALDEITTAETLLSAFQDGAELRQLNLLAGHAVVAPSPLMRQFLRRCCALVEATDGAFDPAVGALLACWRIHGDGSDQGEPSAVSIAEALAACDLRRQLVFDAEGLHLRFAHPATRLDPGAVGKGWALDRAETRLRDAGIRNALIHGGTSTAYALGNEAGRDGWTIAIRHPTQPDFIIAHAHLRDASLSVSGQHGRTTSAGGRTIGHIIDPRSGQPVSDTLLAAVVHPSAMVSDALSTALLVLGAAGIVTLAEQFPDAHFLMLANDGSKRTHGQAFL